MPAFYPPDLFRQVSQTSSNSSPCEVNAGYSRKLPRSCSRVPRSPASRLHQLLWSTQGSGGLAWVHQLFGKVQILHTGFQQPAGPAASPPQLLLDYCCSCIGLQVRGSLESYRGDDSFGHPESQGHGAHGIILWPQATSLVFPQSPPLLWLHVGNTVTTGWALTRVRGQVTGTEKAIGASEASKGVCKQQIGPAEPCGVLVPEIKTLVVPVEINLHLKPTKSPKNIGISINFILI